MIVAKRIWRSWGQSFPLWICAIAVVLLFAGCGSNAPTGTATPPEGTAPETAMELPTDVETAVLEAASELTQVEQSQLAIAEAVPQDWPDGCLGLAEADEVCTAVMVPGWAVTVSDGQQQWNFRTDEEGSVIRLYER